MARNHEPGNHTQTTALAVTWQDLSGVGNVLPALRAICCVCWQSKQIKPTLATNRVIIQFASPPAGDQQVDAKPNDEQATDDQKPNRQECYG